MGLCVCRGVCVYTGGRREEGEGKGGGGSSLCRSICEGRSWPRLRGTENKGPPKISSRLGAAEDRGRERESTKGRSSRDALPASTPQSPQQTAS